MRATLRQLETFLLIHREGSFAAAAKSLGVSQVAISKQIAALERAMGGEMFTRRSGTKAILNARGLSLLTNAEALLEQARKFDQELRSTAATATKVRVIADDVLLNTLFYPNIGNFYRIHTDIQIEFIESQPVLEVALNIGTKQIDLAYLTLSNQPDSIPGKLLAYSEGALFISPNFPGAKSWHNDSKQSLPIIMALSGSAIERSMHKNLMKAGVTNYSVVAHVQHGNSMRQLAIDGLGACLLAKSRAIAAVEVGQLIEMQQIPMQHALGRYVFRQSAEKNTSVDKVEKFLSTLIVDRQSQW